MLTQAPDQAQYKNHAEDSEGKPYEEGTHDGLSEDSAESRRPSMEMLGQEVRDVLGSSFDVLGVLSVDDVPDFSLVNGAALEQGSPEFLC